LPLKLSLPALRIGAELRESALGTLHLKAAVLFVDDHAGN
jgi:hypothetical protein